MDKGPFGLSILGATRPPKIMLFKNDPWYEFLTSEDFKNNTWKVPFNC